MRASRVRCDAPVLDQNEINLSRYRYLHVQGLTSNSTKYSTVRSFAFQFSLLGKFCDSSNEVRRVSSEVPHYSSQVKSFTRPSVDSF